jgi:hypothetical protein
MKPGQFQHERDARAYNKQREGIIPAAMIREAMIRGAMIPGRARL